MVLEKKVLIVDDDRNQIDRIAGIVKLAASELGNRVVLFAADTVLKAKKLLKRYDMDVMLLDIIYKETYAGIELIKYVRETEKYALLPVIIVSDAGKMKEYSYKNLLCYGFCKRNCLDEEIGSLLKTALKYSTLGEDDKQIVLRKNGVLYPVVLQDVLYIKVADHKLSLFLEMGEEVEIKNLTMHRFCERYPIKTFVRCNRNVMVNRIHVERVDLEDRYIIIKEKQERIRIGSSYVENVKMGFYIKKNGSIVV